MEHTPGPWKVIRWEEECVPYGEPIKRVKIVAPDGTVICDNEPYYPMELLEENADIIGAAPELLEVLEGANKLLWEEGYTTSQPEVAAIETVIAKVKGE